MANSVPNTGRIFKQIHAGAISDKQLPDIWYTLYMQWQ